MKKLLFALGVAAMLAFVGAPAQALTVPFTSDHCTGSCGTPPYGDVTLTQVGSDVTFLVRLFDGSGFVRTGAGDGMNFKFNGVGVSLGDIDTSGSSIPLSAAEANPQGSFCGDGGGCYNFGVFFTDQQNGGGSAIANDIVFTVEAATIAELMQPNNRNQIFVADILSGQTGRTGLVDVSPVPVPEPVTTFLLLGLGVVGLVGLKKTF